MSITMPSDSSHKPQLSRRLAAIREAKPVEPQEQTVDDEALARAKDVAMRFAWFVVVGKEGALNSRGKCCFKEPQAAQYAVNLWDEAIGCFLPDGRFYRKGA